MPKNKFYASDKALHILEQSTRTTMSDLWENVAYRDILPDYQKPSYMFRLKIMQIGSHEYMYLLYNETKKNDYWYIGYYDPVTSERRNALDKVSGGTHGAI